MPVSISPITDNFIRVLMIYKPLDNYISVKEQKLVIPSRKGYTVVEWGATLLEN